MSTSDDDVAGYDVVSMAPPSLIPNVAPVDVSVLVPIRDEAAFIRETSRAITSQDFQGSVEFLMIDGASQDGTRTILDELALHDPRVRVLDNPQGDLASALCIGLDAARGEFVAKMDAHTHFPRSYLRAGVDRLRQGDVNWVSGPPIPHGVNPWSRQVGLALGTRMGMGGSGKWPAAFQTGDREQERELDTGVFSGVWRRSVLQRLGGWDPKWPVNEDSELASRYLAAGERILCLWSMGAHYVPRSSPRSLARQYFHYGYYRVKTAIRHPASMRASHLAPPAMVAVLAAGALGGKHGRRLARLSLLSYGVAQAQVCLRVARGGAREDAVMLPAVLTTMHLSFGAGYLTGCLRFGVPLAGLRRLVERDGARRDERSAVRVQNVRAPETAHTSSRRSG
jgi:succinoglycan biosynthesis protein ExoA